MTFEVFQLPFKLHCLSSGLPWNMAGQLPKSSVLCRSYIASIVLDQSLLNILSLTDIEIACGFRLKDVNEVFHKQKSPC